MRNDDGLSIIHKKARVAREDFDARAMSPAKALRLAFAQAAEDGLDMALTVTTLEQTRVGTAGLTEGLSEMALLILLDGAGGARGAAIFDSQVVAALIEMQVTGKVRAGEAHARPYTRTDAAMMAPLLDAGLSGADALLAKEQEGYQPGQFRFGDKVEDARVLSLALQGREFDLFHMNVEIENGAKSGSIRLALPVRPAPPKSAPAGRAGASGPTTSLRSLAMDAPVTLNAVLSRIRRPLDEICSLEPGMLLPVAPEAIGQADLVARPSFIVAEGRLGQMGGMRAIRIQMAHEERGQALSGTGRDPAFAATGKKDVTAHDLAQIAPAALQPGPELPATLSTLEEANDDPAKPDLAELPDLTIADTDLSQWEDGTAETGEEHEQGDMPLPEPLPMLDVP